jgi:hypothetical protein
MVESLGQIFNNSSLYGHCLTGLPEKAWEAAMTDDLILYQQPDPGSAQIEYCIFEKYTVTERYPNGNVKSFIAATNVLPGKYIELLFRRVVGALITAALYLTAAPLGFAIKVIHHLGQQLANLHVSSDKRSAIA